jgi:hypothetical protein
MTIAIGKKLGRYEIRSRSVRVSWARFISRKMRNFDAEWH